MPLNDYLVLSRGQWDEDASPEAVQQVVDTFYDWYEKGLAQGWLKPGSRLAHQGCVVSRGLVTDGPFAETKELVGGYWFIVAETLAQAAAIAAENPCLRYGLSTEIRPLEASRSDVNVPTNETPGSWLR